MTHSVINPVTFWDLENFQALPEENEKEEDSQVSIESDAIAV